MSLVLLRYLAMVLGPAMTSTARPATTFLAVQLTVVALVDGQWAALPEGWEILISGPLLAVVAVFALLENLAAHDPDISALLRDLGVERIAAAFGALSAALLFSALGISEAEASALAGVEGQLLSESGGLLEAVAVAAATDHGPAVQFGVVALAVALNLSLAWLRAGLLRFIQEFGPAKLWARIESGGVVGVLILLPLFPLVVLGFLLVMAVALTVASLTARTAASAADQKRRTPCKACDYNLRVEASCCPECGAERTPEGIPTSGL